MVILLFIAVLRSNTSVSILRQDFFFNEEIKLEKNKKANTGHFVLAYFLSSYPSFNTKNNHWLLNAKKNDNDNDQVGNK